MSTQCTSSVFSMAECATGLWGNSNINIFGVSDSNKLHEPTCRSQCCSTRCSEIIQSNDFNGLEQHVVDEYVLTPVASENKFLFDINTSYDQVPEHQGAINQILVDNFGTGYSEVCCVTPVEKVQYSDSYKSRAEAECVKRSNCKGVVKRKRKRTVFTTEQIIAMEGVFKKRPYVSRDERLVLTQRLNLSEKAIKIWFQNRRRITERRDKDQSDSCHSDSTIEEMYDTHTSRLDYIQSRINQRTDVNGFVTLDHDIITELASIIDNVLPYSTDYDTTSFKNNSCDTPCESYLMYEPISPESLSEENREIIPKWEPLKPEESLQRLIDIQTVLYS